MSAFSRIFKKTQVVGTHENRDLLFIVLDTVINNPSIFSDIIFIQYFGPFMTLHLLYSTI